MTSRTSLMDDKKFSDLVNDFEPESRKRHKSAGDCNCQASKNFSLHTNPIVDFEEREPKISFLRSYSFGNDAQIIRKIKAAKESCEPLSKWIESPLKKGLFPKKLDDKEKYNKNFGLTRCEEEPETEQENLSLYASKLKPRSPSIPIEKQRKVSEESKHSILSNLSSDGSNASIIEDKSNNDSASSSSQDLLSSAFTPFKEAWINWDISNSASRVASNISTTFGNVYRESFRRKQNSSNKVSRSSTFHNGSRNSLPKIKTRKESLDSATTDIGKSMPRSSTLPVSPRLTQSGNELSGSPGGSFPYSSSNFGISRLTSRHSEVLFEGLKSAVTSVSSKLNEFRSSLSASNTPVKSKS